MPTTAIEHIGDAILLLRGKRVILDRDLARIYGVPTKVLNQAVKRNQVRFPDDFMFRLTQEEEVLSRSRPVTLNTGRGKNVKYLPYAFTEHGACHEVRRARAQAPDPRWRSYGSGGTLGSR
jgi:hypothetical protein